jgi:hypothetical protein
MCFALVHTIKGLDGSTEDSVAETVIVAQDLLL